MVGWVAKEWACEPRKWALLALVVALWPATQVFAPFGSASTPGAARDLAYEVAFVASGIGVACALDALEMLPSCAYAIGLRPSWQSEWAALLAGGSAVQLAALTFPLASMQSEMHIDFSFTAHLLVASAAFAAVGLVLLRVRMPAGMRPWSLLAVAWILPVLAPPAFVPAFLRTGSRTSLDDSSNHMLMISQIVSISALLLGVHLTDAHRRLRP